MRTIFSVCLFAFVAGVMPIAAQSLSGTADTRLVLSAGAGGAPDFSWGAEEYANLRLKVPVRDAAAFYGAFNLTAAAGSIINDARAYAAATGADMPFIAGENYAGSLELERLYLQINGDSINWSAGLLRMPFGFGLVWGPMDFINPRNPLQPDARLRGALGTIGSWYPVPGGDARLFAFAAAPKDPLKQDGGGARFALGFENHWEKASAQFLYSFETPAAYTPQFVPALEYSQGLHRAGLSLKADMELGFSAELLYTLDPASPDGIRGLSASAGADYSFFDGKLLVLAEYLYSGADSITARNAANPAGYAGRHFLYVSGTWSLSDFTRINLGGAYAFDDLSALPIAGWEHEPLQGITVYARLQAPLDRESFDRGTGGELGPAANRTRVLGTAGVKVKF
ncbi:MAG: hypothetical protein LBD37_03335 [Treponema sp.]|nr:hypothetical protein [Treponema sp.]